MDAGPPRRGLGGPPRPRLRGILKLFYPGVGVKRWLLVGAAGIALCSIGVAYLLRKVFSLGFPDFLPSYLEGVVLLVVGLAVILAAAYGLYRSLGPLLFPRGSSIHTLADAIYTRRTLRRGPRIVAIGGGTGLSVLLRGLKLYTDNLTAIVTVADDGGSSGRLRRELGVLPPGDFRNCIVAMSDAETLMQELFQYRFPQGNGLEGHSFGNLFIAAMTDVTGSFVEALRASSRVLAVHGQILPSTLDQVVLAAELEDGRVVRGESRIPEGGGRLRRVFLEPSEPEAYGPAVEAIAQAQLVIIGPGSLYTSILPNLMVPDIAAALRSSPALKVYVCNVATQKGETLGFTVADHVEALQEHTFPEVADWVLINSRPVSLGPRFLGGPVLDDGRPLPHVRVAQAELMDPDHPVRHDSDKLAKAIMDVYHGRHRPVPRAQPAGGRSTAEGPAL